LTPFFFDTSVLVAGLIEIGDSSEHPQRIMNDVAAGRIRRIQTAWHCCLEFYSVATRLPEELRITPSDALRLVEEEILARFEVHQLPERDRRPFLNASAHGRVVGGRIYDAHIAEIALRSGARTVVTENVRHFSPLLRHGIKVVASRDFRA